MTHLLFCGLTKAQGLLFVHEAVTVALNCVVLTSEDSLGNQEKLHRWVFDDDSAGLLNSAVCGLRSRLHAHSEPSRKTLPSAAKPPRGCSPRAARR